MTSLRFKELTEMFSQAASGAFAEMSEEVRSLSAKRRVGLYSHPKPH